MNQRYWIDSFGNLSGVVSGQPTTTFDPTTNRISNLPCASSTQAFDSAGNQLCDIDQYGGVSQLAYDTESRIAKITASNNTAPYVSYLYQADGGRARKTNADGTFTEYVSFGGSVIAEKDQNGTWTDNIFSGSTRIARAQQASVQAHLSGNRIDPSQTSQVTSVYVIPVPNNYVVKSGDKLS